MNGLKYTPSDGTVRMRWWTDEDGAHFAVIDTGIGIPAEHIPRLTERFYRVDAGRSRGEGGSGLGLAIVKHALQRHGGWLDVEAPKARAAPSPVISPRSGSAGWDRAPPPAIYTDASDMDTDAGDMDAAAGDMDADAGSR